MKSITVKAPQAKAFRAFTDGFDSWWPREHHIGSSPMTKGVIENKEGGRCYAMQEDGTECDWGRVLVWEAFERMGDAGQSMREGVGGPGGWGTLLELYVASAEAAS